VQEYSAGIGVLSPKAGLITALHEITRRYVELSHTGAPYTNGPCLSQRRRGMTKYVTIDNATGKTVTTSIVSRTALVKSQSNRSPDAC
jgi:hypothetical protein